MTLDFDELPVSERIAQTLQDRVARVKLREAYNVDVLEIVRPTRTVSYSPKHGLCELTQPADTENEDLSVPGNPPLVARDQPFALTFYLLLPDKDPTPIDRIMSLFRADVVAAITLANESGVAAPNWHNFDDLSIDAHFGPSSIFNTSDGQLAGLTIRLLVTYRTPEGNAYAAVGQ